VASMNTDEHGCRRLQWNEPGGKRRTLRLGKLPSAKAVKLKERVEHLILAKQHGEMEPELAAWVAKLDDELHAKLAAVELVLAREAGQLGPWLEKYLEERVELKPGSKVKLQQTEKKLLAFFTAPCRLRSITKAQAAEWWASLLKEGLSMASAKIHAGNAKAFFNAALRRQLVNENPFLDLKSGPTPANLEHFVTLEVAQRVLQACPDVRSQVLFGLARFAGLRVPSESHLLTWDDVDFVRRRLRVRSPKTERHQGKAFREVPITQHLLPILLEAWQKRSGDYVVTIRGNGYIHNGLQRIIRKAGVEVWEDLYQALRRSFGKDLVHLGGFHEATVAQWTGHSLTVSQRHYTKGVPDEVFDKATAFGHATQNPTQQLTEVGGSSGKKAENEKGPESSNSSPFRVLPADAPICLVEIRGLEPLTFSMPSRRSPN